MRVGPSPCARSGRLGKLPCVFGVLREHNLVPLLQSGLGTTWFSVHVVVPFMFLLLYSYCGLASYNYIGCIYTEESNGI